MWLDGKNPILNSVFLGMFRVMVEGWSRRWEGRAGKWKGRIERRSVGSWEWYGWSRTRRKAVAREKERKRKRGSQPANAARGIVGLGGRRRLRIGNISERNVGVGIEEGLLEYRLVGDVKVWMYAFPYLTSTWCTQGRGMEMGGEDEGWVK